MNRLLIFLLVCIAAPCCMLAQTTQDFAARFMKENAGNKEYKCVTVGPKMLEELLKLKCEEEDGKKFKEIISNVKSVRIVTSESEAEKCRKAALELLEKNSKRYSLYKSKDSAADYGDCMWVRRRSKQIVEFIYIEPAGDREFMILNVTGLMADGFIDELIGI